MSTVRSQESAGQLRWPSYAIGRLHREARETVERELSAVGLVLREYFVLTHIAELPMASQQEIADRALMDRSDLVKLLDRLEERQLITRERDPADRRRHVLALTPAGEREYTRGTEASERGTAAAFAALSPAERRTLHRLSLKALGENPAFAG